MRTLNEGIVCTTSACWLAASWTLIAAVSALGQSSAPADKADALWDAARNGDAAAVTRLLDAGVDVNAKFRYGATALSYACDRGHLEVVKVLLARGADVNVKDTFYGSTPLLWAVSPAMARKPQHVEIVRLLLERGARNKDDALISAASAPDAEMTKAILETGSFSPSALSDALESAAESKDQNVIALLERAGAKPHVDFTMDETQLRRFAGRYLSADGDEMVLVVAGVRLTSGPPRPPLTFAARDETTFRIVGRPGVTLTFTLDDGSATSFAWNMGGTTTTYTRAMGR